MPRHSLFAVVALSLCTVAPTFGCASLGSMFGGNNNPSTYQEPSPEQRRQSYVDQNPELDAPVREAIVKGSVIEGMNEDQVRASLGRPIAISAIMPETPESGDESWGYEHVVYGKTTEYHAGGTEQSRTFGRVHDTLVRFYKGTVVGVDDLGFTSRNDMEAQCHSGSMEACERLESLDARAASQPPA